MRQMTATEVAALAAGRLIGDAGARVGPDVVIDTRQATPGCLFVAIPGERVDGHDFTAAAKANGAAAVLVARATDADLPHIVVGDPVTGLSSLAHGVVAAEQARGLTVLAITGSSGKTSTKDLLAQILENDAPTVSPVGSLNNEIGVPLTACRVTAETRYLISEMGSRGIGHVARLCSITHPRISAVLNVGHAHIGEFGSQEVTAQAKGEIVEALDADGWAVLNADDPLVAGMATRTKARIAWFTVGPASVPHVDAPLVVRALDSVGNALQQFRFTLAVEGGGRERETHPVSLQVIGAHQVANAAAAAAAAIAAGVSPAAVAAALSAASTRSKWRMDLHVRPDGAAIINDAYNANPDSMSAALRTLAAIGAARRSEDHTARAVAILGDMLELGADAAAIHAATGRLAAQLGIDEVIAIGSFADDIVAGVRQAGGSARALSWDAVADSVALAPADVALVKASRGMALERVADALAASCSTGERDDQIGAQL